MSKCHICNNKLHFWQIKCKICRYNVWLLPQILFTIVAVSSSVLVLMITIEYFLSGNQNFQNSAADNKPRITLQSTDSDSYTSSQSYTPTRQEDTRNAEQIYRQKNRDKSPEFIEQRLQEKRSRLK